MNGDFWVSFDNTKQKPFLPTGIWGVCSKEELARIVRIANPPPPLSAEDAYWHACTGTPLPGLHPDVQAFLAKLERGE